MTVTAQCVDVVLPVFNGRSTIEQALDSVLKQSGPWLHHIIVVDDGSTDGTADLVASLGQARIQLLRTPNQGVAAARNLGVQTAQAPWIAFLDADDWWLQDKLQKQLQAAEQHGAGFVCGAVNNQAVQGLAALSAWTLCKGNTVATSSVLVQRDVLLRIAPVFQTGMPFAEDYLAWLKCLTITPGYYVASTVAMYLLSPVPRYRWGVILRNMLRMNGLYAQFLWRQKLPLHTKTGLPLALLAGSLVSLASIGKRFLQSARAT
jgi:teichuronic acid biosynthesis glycosyltransferase TuaG